MYATVRVGFVLWVCMRTRTSARTGTSLVRPEPRTATGDEYMHVMYNQCTQSEPRLPSTYGTRVNGSACTRTARLMSHERRGQLARAPAVVERAARCVPHVTFLICGARSSSYLNKYGSAARSICSRRVAETEFLWRGQFCSTRRCTEGAAPANRRENGWTRIRAPSRCRTRTP